MSNHVPSHAPKSTSSRITRWLGRSIVAALAVFNAARAAEPSTAARGTGTDYDFDYRAAVHYLASDELEGRFIGTPGIDKAADFIADNFKKLGLAPAPGNDGYFQPFKMTTATRPAASTALRATLPGGEADTPVNYEQGEQFVPLSFSGEGEFSAPVVFVGYGVSSKEFDYDDYAGVDVKGKVALALRYEPHDNQGLSRFTHAEKWSQEATLDRKAKAAAAAGAAALVLVNPPAFNEDDDPLMPFAGTYRGEQAPIPFVQARRAVVDSWLKASGANDLRRLQKGIDDGGKPASFPLGDDLRVGGVVGIERVEKDVKNVVAMLPGTGAMADRYLVVGAHYDHLGHGLSGSSLAPTSKDIHNGADDNASGTAAMLELAERFAKSGSNGRSILFVAFTAEEEGLIGSAHFANHPPVPLDRIDFMVNLDMVGRVSNGVVYVGGFGTAASLEKIVNAADEASPLQFKSFGAGGFGPSDHMTFAMKKVPVLFIHSGLHADYHRPTDDADKVNYEGLGQVVDFTAHILGDLLTLPKEAYVDAADAHSMFGSGVGQGSPGSGSPGGARVSLGVVPDYAPGDDQAKGVRISGTVPGSPASAAGLKEGDVLVQFGDDRIDTLYDLTDALRKGKPGQKVKVAFLRDGKRQEAEATLVERKG